MDFALVAFGLGVGILVGMTGIGGGSLMTPMLILVFGVTPTTAIGTDLAYAAVTKTVGGYKHWKQRTVDLELSTWMAIGSVPAAVFGVYVLTLLEDWLGSNFEDTVLTLLAGALLLTGTATLVRALLKRMQARERDTIEMERRHKIAAVALGVSVGFVLGVTSAGSGALIAVGLILFFRLTPQRVVGTDVFHAAILLWAAGLSHVVAGNVDFGLAGTILLGSVPGVWLGSHWSVRVDPAVLRVTLAVVLIGAGLALLIKAGPRHPDRRDRPVPGGGDRPAGGHDGPVPEGARRGERMMVVMTPEADSGADRGRGGAASGGRRAREGDAGRADHRDRRDRRPGGRARDGPRGPAGRGPGDPDLAPVQARVERAVAPRAHLVRRQRPQHRRRRRPSA